VQVVAVGVSHTSAPIELRERLAVSAERLTDTLRLLRERTAESFILSTCNRVELYAVCGHEDSGADVLRQFLAAHGGIPVQAVRDASYALGHQSAVRHLLRVAAGLDSMVLGENEILGQLRRALAAARHAGTLGPVLDRLGDVALACGKRTRSSTALGHQPDSVASVAVRLAMREHEELPKANVLVLGAGETARAVLAQLSTLGSTRVAVVNRTYERAVDAAAAHGFSARHWDDLADALSEADVVIGCTGAPGALVGAALLEHVRDTSAQPLLCVDLGVPRDIEPGVASLPGIRLIELHRIESEAAAHRSDRTTREVVRAESIVAQDTERYMEWWRGRGVATTITRLRARAEDIRAAEVERAMARLPELGPHARAVVRELATRMVNKLLHEPTLALKRDPEGANMALVIERLFALQPEVVNQETHQESMAS
jgi:glutamyl-tRNA reductase